MSKSASEQGFTWIIALFAAITAINPFAIDMYLPAMTQIADDLSSSTRIMQLSISLYLFGYAVGLVIFGPLTERIGQKRLVIFGLVGFACSNVMLVMANEQWMFLALRGFQAFIGSAAIVTIPAFMRRVYGKQMAKGMSYVAMIMMLAPMIAPTIGAALLHIGSWHLIFTALTAYTLLILIIAILTLPNETRATPPKPVQFFKAYQLVLSNKAVYAKLGIITVSSFSFFAYITAIPAIYLEVYKLSETKFSVLFGMNVIALIVAHFINTRLVGRIGSENIIKYAPLVNIVAALAILGIAWFELGLYAFVALLPILIGSNALVSTNIDALIHLSFADSSGPVSAVNGTLRFSIGSLSGPVLAFFYDGSPLPYAVLVAVSSIVVLALLFWDKQSNQTPHSESAIKAH